MSESCVFCTYGREARIKGFVFLIRTSESCDCHAFRGYDRYTMLRVCVDTGFQIPKIVLELNI